MELEIINFLNEVERLEEVKQTQRIDSFISENNDKLKEIEEFVLLRNEVFNTARSLILAKIFPFCENLKKMNLWGNKIGSIEEASSLGFALSQLENLEELSLESNDLNDDTAPEIISLLPKTLTHLNLDNNLCREPPIANYISNLKRLRVLFLPSSNMLLEDIILIMQQLEKLEELKLDYVRIKPLNLEKFLNSLPENLKKLKIDIVEDNLEELNESEINKAHNLEELSLEVKEFKKQHKQSIVFLISRFPNLKKFNYSNNNKYDDFGFKYLSKNISSLYINTKNISKDGELVNYISTFNNLKSLSINLYKMEDEVFKLVFTEVELLANITDLQLYGVGLKDSHIKLLCKALSKLKNLESLRLGSNDITDIGVIELYETLRNCNKLLELDLSYNKFSKKGIEFIAKLEQVNIFNLQSYYPTISYLLTLSKLLINKNKNKDLFINQKDCDKKDLYSFIESINVSNTKILISSDSVNYLNTDFFKKLEYLMLQTSEDNLDSKENSSKLLFRGKLYDELSAYQEALNCFDKGLKVTPNNPHLIAWKGNILIKINKLSEAIKYFNKALTIDSTIGYIYSWKGNSLYKLGNFAEALECFNHALLLDVSNRKVNYNNKAITLYSLNRPEESLKCFEKFTEFHGISTLNKGKILFSLENYEEALDCFGVLCDEEIKSASDFWGIKTLIKLGKFNQVSEEWESLCKSSYKKEKLSKNIIQFFKEDHPEIFSYIHLKKLIYDKKYNKALEYSNKLIKKQKNIPDLWSQKAHCYFGLKKYKESIKLYDKFFNLYLIDEETSSWDYDNLYNSLDNLVESLIILERYKEILEYTDILRKINPIFPTAKHFLILYKKARCLYCLEMLDKALDCCNSILNKISDDNENKQKTLDLKIKILRDYKDSTTNLNKLRDIEQEFSKLDLWEDCLECKKKFTKNIALDVVLENQVQPLISSGKYKEALNHLKNLAIVYNNNFEIFLVEGLIYLKMGNKEKALKCFERMKDMGYEQIDLNITKSIKFPEKSDNKNIHETIELTETLRDKLNNSKISTKIKKLAEEELLVLDSMNNTHDGKADHATYLKNLLNLPWGKYSNSKVSYKKIAKELNKSHSGTQEIKQKILEIITFTADSKKPKFPILCLVGSPGVGKTSIAYSIANAIGRKCVRMSLGGLEDSCIIRGFSRSYRNATPSKILTLINQAGTWNPVMILDEIDKVAQRGRGGDVVGSLLALLDPVQNSKFKDDYFDAEFDLSQVMFVATANNIENIPYPLRDRMTTIKIDGYSNSEKLDIAKNYLLPKILEEGSIKRKEFYIADDTIKYLIKNFTKESGVRSLERILTELAQKYKLSEKLNKKCDLTVDAIDKWFISKKLIFPEILQIPLLGKVNGLAYTEAGGDLIIIEAKKIPGTGKIKATGKLGEVLKESIDAAFTCLISKMKKSKTNQINIREYDIHIHIPVGSVPKEGTSAGMAVYIALASLLMDKKVKQDIAMTGEITLYGELLAVGEIKEKISAAARSGIKTVIIPRDNAKDLAKLPDGIKAELNIEVVSSLERLETLCLTNQ
ncbi:MAG: tetratricopeptide repeat protein [Rickettsiaceae bacterium]|nr:tetratricopeptide repeat protein [Rickettsiaceae bacterium]